MSESESSSNVESKAMKVHFTELVKRALLHAGGLRELEEKLDEIVRRTSRLPAADEDPPTSN